jgi:hypothetical protein
MKITIALMKFLGMDMHDCRRMIKETIGDDKHAMILIARANVMGGSNASFIPYAAFQPVHESPPKAATNGSWTIHSPIPKLSAS